MHMKTDYMKENILTNLRHRLIKDTIWVSILGVGGKSIGFLIPFFIAAWFGINAQTDAFFFAYGIILFFAGILSPVVESVIVPYIVEARNNKRDIASFTGSILSLSGIGLAAVLILFLLISRPFLHLITRFDLQTIDLVYYLLIEISPLVILLVWTSILAGTLNAYKRFTIPSLSPIFRAIVCLIIIFSLKGMLGVHSITLGYLTGEIIRLIILFWACGSLLSLKLQWVFRLTPEVKDFLVKGFYQTFGMAIRGLNPLVDKTMASWLSVGSVSVLHYADRLFMIPVTIATSGLMITILSHWSEIFYSQNQDMSTLKKEIEWAIKIITLPLLIVTIGLILMSEPIVNIVFSNGMFDSARLPELRWTWICYMLGLPGYIIGLVYVRAYLVLKMTRQLMEIAFLTVIVNVLLNFILMYYLGVKGIALSTTISIIITTIIQVMVLKRKLRNG